MYRQPPQSQVLMMQSSSLAQEKSSRKLKMTETEQKEVFERGASAAKTALD